MTLLYSKPSVVTTIPPALHPCRCRGLFDRHSPVKPLTAKKLIETFFEICRCVSQQNGEEIRKFMPTVSDLLSQYRKLLLPDVIVDEWTDAKSR